MQKNKIFRLFSILSRIFQVLVTLLQLGERLLEEEKCLTYQWNMDKQKITASIISAAPSKDGTAAYPVVLYHINFVEKFKNTKLHIDGTYNSRPRGLQLGRSSQFLSIMVDHDGKVSIKNCC